MFRFVVHKNTIKLSVIKCIADGPHRRQCMGHESRNHAQ